MLPYTFIHVKSAKHMAPAHCLKSYRYRSRPLDNVHIIHEKEEKIVLSVTLPIA